MTTGNPFTEVPVVDDNFDDEANPQMPQVLRRMLNRLAALEAEAARTGEMATTVSNLQQAQTAV